MVKKTKVEKSIGVAIGKNIKQNINVDYKNIVKTNDVKYPTSKVNVANLEKFSKWIINKYGERKPIIVGGILALLGLSGILFSLNSISDIFFSFLPSWFKAPSDIAVPFIVISVIIFGLGCYLLSLIQYKYESKCPKCNTFYALEEIGVPAVRQVKAHDGVKKTTTRHYKCKFCDFTKSEPFTETIPYETQY
ncbi:hypothetical protein COS83_02895 [archaeon CG07_land_8_20_14_0_80_38_8]|nr:MAG: hypothetical protein COS83_02895 [archaeon CG07_land_8_20_14_0_80_38_8]PIU89176.1 MAG: hypothetical protein COS64_01130 [archaeon CG06_land_8_20_14_3_00_37_11]